MCVWGWVWCLFFLQTQRIGFVFGHSYNTRCRTALKRLALQCGKHRSLLVIS